MPLDIYPTTAENVIAATDAVTTREDGCDDNYVAEFIDIPYGIALNALEMAKQLNLVTQDPALGNLYRPVKPYALYLVTAIDVQKAAVLRLVLENYQPYCAFKQRLIVTRSAATAAGQVKLIYSLTPHRDEIKDTFISLGTFTQSLITEGAGSFKVVDFENANADFLRVVADVAANRGLAEVTIRRRLGDEVANWINQQDVLSTLITAYQRVGIGDDDRACVVHAGNGIESFLVQFGAHKGINLAGANGINAKVDRIGNHLNAKHKNMLKYLGHVRNAADHGVDAEIGNPWEISSETATEYVHVAMSTIRSIVKIELNMGFII